jgi:hypothetical protein
MKSLFTFSEEFNFFQVNLPSAIEDHDFNKIPIPDEMALELFGDLDFDSEIQFVEDFSDFLNEFKDYDNYISYEVPIFSDTRKSKFQKLIDDYGKDAFGMYLPFHYYFSSGKWGIYLFVDIINDRAQELYNEQHNFFKQTDFLTLNEIKKLYYYAVYRHEFFHYQTEVYTTRAEILGHKPLYINYNRYVKKFVKNSENWLEEALAESSVLSSRLVTKITKISSKSLKALYEYDLKFMPPGYRDYKCKKYGGPLGAHVHLASQILQTKVDPLYFVPQNHIIKKDFFHDFKEVPVYLVRFNKKIRIQ